MILFVACAVTPYDAVDLQLDVDAALPEAAATLHVCASSAGMLDAGAGNGRMVMTGLPVGPLEVTVNVLDADGASLGAATAWFDTGVLYGLAQLVPGEVCRDPGDRAPEGTESWVLGVRFAEPSWS